LFLSLVAETAAIDPALAQQALLGLRRYQQAALPPPRPLRPQVAQVRGTTLVDCGGSGPLVMLVPSVINPPHILDLGRETSLARALARQSRVLLLDWGPARDRAELDLAGHVDALLLPLLDEVGPAVLAGYCLGGTMALLAAGQSTRVQAVATLASPWRFSAYGRQVPAQLAAMWESSRAAAKSFGGLPMEVLQSAFWALDPQRVVAKYARYAGMAEGSAEADSFVALEDWANGGEPLPVPAARELVEDLFGKDLSGRGEWRQWCEPACPLLHITASGDRIVPAASVAAGPAMACPAGHVGMIAGRRASDLLHAPLLSWLEGLGRGR
jgi:polyhydroxyalkanoate synthase